ARRRVRAEGAASARRYQGIRQSSVFTNRLQPDDSELIPRGETHPQEWVRPPRRRSSSLSRTADNAPGAPTRMRLPAVKSLVLATAAAAFLALGASSPALAGSTPCWRALINDWYDGRIDQTYPIGCYQDAIAHLPQDVDTYSSAKEDIQRAMLAQIRNGRNDPPTWTQGSNGSTSSSDHGSKSIITR